ncbi:MAG: hypothetical protein HY860_01865 [Chlamydiales bacterium]|nr:hypothetical protein [Chlamydiales bacterium]
MAIYNIFDYTELSSQDKLQQPDLFADNYDDFLKQEGKDVVNKESKGRIFSALAARFFFALLLLADLVWSVYCICLIAIKILLCTITVCKINRLLDSFLVTWLSFKRSLVCGVALFVAIFAPALGIMFSCMYFLMYDKTGVDEVVPASLRDQFKDFLPSEWF